MPKFLHYLILFLSLTISQQGLSVSGSTLFDSDVRKDRKSNSLPQVKSLTIYKNQLAESLPIIQLNSNDLITVEFDLLSPLNIPLWYKIDHCSSDWESSGLFYQDFQTGFDYNPLPGSYPSRNTLIPYQHYQLFLPNPEFSILISGNYKIYIYDSPGSNEAIFETKFFVTENIGKIEGQLTPSRNADLQRSHQEINFEYQHNLNIDNPYRDLLYVITQNRNFLQPQTKLQPDYIQSGKLIFKNDPGLTWPGYNEFRVFNSKDIRFASDGIDSIRFENQLYQFYLTPYENLRFKRYRFYRDLNGQFRPDKSASSEPGTEADYYEHHFSFPFEAPLIEEKLYLYGEFSDYKLKPEFELSYNLQQKRYETTLLLKQGYYNYTIVTENKKGEIEFGRFDGFHSMTENEYQIFIYYQSPSERHQRLIAASNLSGLLDN